MRRDEPKGGERVLGARDDGRPGPTVVITAGLHGNEPAGVIAAKRVLTALEDARIGLRGKVVGLAGNLGALAEASRYRVRDLNRGWTREHIRTLGPSASGEDEEQRELLKVIAPLLAQAREPIVFFDLHSTSSSGAPFCCMADVLRNRPIAFALRVPVVLGLEEVIDGSMLGYLCDLGHVGVALEAGQHQDPATAERHTSAIWLMLAAAGAVDAADVPDWDHHVGTMAAAAGGLPSVVEIRHRHVVQPDDNFVMRPGFTSFQRVEKGEVVAKDTRGKIRTPEAGLMMMPRYQGLGEDGYFLARAVSPAWLDVSARLRANRLDRLVPLLPGVRRDPEDKERFFVDARVARLRVSDVFHLFGFRRVRPSGANFAFSRRRPDHRAVEALPDELEALLARA